MGPAGKLGSRSTAAPAEGRGCGALGGRLLVALAATALFDLAYSQLPLHDGNYPAYALHGVADAGRGALAGDWYAGTTDPFPLVSLLVRLACLLHPALLHALHAMLLGVYLCSLVSIAASLDERLRGWRAWLLGCVLVLAHSTLLRAGVTAATGGDWGWYLQGGLAMQYLVGFIFQPSLFGVLLVASLAAFLRGRDLAAAVLAALAVDAHFSYLLTALGLLAGYGLLRWRQARRSGLRRALRLWLVGLAALAPGLLVALRFAPTSAEAFARAQALLVELRIPQHALPSRWIHRSGLIALALVLGALLALSFWRTRAAAGPGAGVDTAPRGWSGAVRALALLLLLLVCLGGALTVLQLLTGSHRLALLFPWRVSALLVPLATTTLLARLVAALPEPGRSARRVSGALAAALVVLAAAHGLRASLRDARAFAAEPALPVMRAVRSRGPTAAELYAIPTDLRRFRLETGARVLVDWKAHPYRDREVIEWHERLLAARGLERARGEELCHAGAALRARYQVTHLVLAARQAEGLRCAGLAERYRDARYVVVEVR